MMYFWLKYNISVVELTVKPSYSKVEDNFITHKKSLNIISVRRIKQTLVVTFFAIRVWMEMVASIKTIYTQQELGGFLLSINRFYFFNKIILTTKNKIAFQHAILGVRNVIYQWKWISRVIPAPYIWKVKRSYSIKF